MFHPAGKYNLEDVVDTDSIRSRSLSAKHAKCLHDGPTENVAVCQRTVRNVTNYRALFLSSKNNLICIARLFYAIFMSWKPDIQQLLLQLQQSRVVYRNGKKKLLAKRYRLEVASFDFVIVATMPSCFSETK